MPRQRRIVVPDSAHHVTQRGNQQQQIFFSDADRRVYLDLISESAEVAQVELWGWCLMSNHVHWLVLPKTPEGLSRLFRRAHGDYARYRNRLRGTTGHLWQSRYYSCPLEGQHLWCAMAYVERNPVRAGLVRKAEDYIWSSLRPRLGIAPKAEWFRLETWRRQFDPEQWRNVISSSLSAEASERRLREATVAGKPIGGVEFVRRLAEDFHCDTEIRPSGRPAASRRLCA